MTRHASSGLDVKHLVSRDAALAKPLGDSLGRYAARSGKSGLTARPGNGGDQRSVGIVHSAHGKEMLDGMSSTHSLSGESKAGTLGTDLKPCFMPNLAKRMQKAIEKSGKSQASIARALGVTPQAVTGWVTSGRISKDMLVRFATETGADLAHLMGSKGNTESAQHLLLSKVPVISWVQAGQKNLVVDPYQPGASEDWEDATVKVSDGSYALRVRGDSMVSPDGTGFPEGCIIIVDPNQEPRNGDYVVVRFANSDEATFKKYVIDGPSRILRPLNPDYPTIPLTDDASISGVVVEWRIGGRFR